MSGAVDQPGVHDAAAAAGRAAARDRVCELKQQLNALRTRDADLLASQARIERERAAVATAIEQAEAELDTAVAAPVVGGEDPTLWLPDELLLQILLIAVTHVDGCSAVCRRWERLCQDRAVENAAWFARWRQYATGARRPRMFAKLKGAGSITALCIDELAIFCGTEGGCVEVLSPTDGSAIATLTGHVYSVLALALGPDNVLYTASEDSTVRVWSRDNIFDFDDQDPGHVRTANRTLRGHAAPVFSLAASEENLFSGDGEGTICVWECSTGNLVHQLIDEGGCVHSLALNSRNQLYSGSESGTIRLWSLTDYTVLRILRAAPSAPWDVAAMLVDKSDTLFSGYGDGRIRVWSGVDGALIRTIDTQAELCICSMVFAPNGAVSFVTSDAASNAALGVWQDGQTILMTLPEDPSVWGAAVAVTHDGRLCVSSRHRLWYFEL